MVAQWPAISVKCRQTCPTGRVENTKFDLVYAALSDGYEVFVDEIFVLYA